MHRTLATFFSLAALLAATTTPAATPDPSMMGLWLTEKKGVLIELYPCKDEVCGRIVWLAKPYWRSGELRVDKHNPDPALRNRPWCGSEVIEGLKENGSGALTKGQFYYLGDGGTYSLELKPGDDGSVRARAYLGIKLLGKTETWTRPGPDISPGCPETN